MKFNPKEKVEKIAVMKEGILFSRTRIIEGMEFVQAGGLKVEELGSLFNCNIYPLACRKT